MALSAAFLEELRARIPLAALVGKRVKLSRSGRNWKGCCPFHDEKSASFYVYDDHFHCFGCGVHGDAISFVMQNQGAAFVEAVEQLAAEAGLEVPKPSPLAVAAERQRLDLHGVLDAAQMVFARRLFEPEGAPGLAYLRGRGLADDIIRRFGLGWSGEGRGALVAELQRRDIAPDRLIEAGLLRAADESGPAREFYFNRVTFPIRDRRGRVLSFGARTLGDAKPKYINGPESPVFSKKRTLYALDLARDAVQGGAALVLVEGYMDVIALHQAGFGGAVAPLGTALTDEQLEALWRLSPGPVLCFDGDAAGGRAAARAAELALPMLTPDRTLRFAALPQGEDPDTLVRTQGAARVQAVLEGAQPLSEALFGLLQENGLGDTPEQRASFKARLEAAAARIKDRSLASEYRRALLDRFFASRRRGAVLPRSQSSGRRAARPVPDADGTYAKRARVLVALLLRHPALLHDVEEAFAAVDLTPTLARLREAALHWAESAENLDAAGLMTHLNASGLAAEAAQALSAFPEPLPDCAKPDAMPAEAEAGWWHIFGLLHRARLEEEVATASRDFAARQDEAAQRRLIALCTARNALVLLEQGQDADA